jgi:hypothetical protein
MSSRRSRSGGTKIGITFRRKNRSSRKRPARSRPRDPCWSRRDAHVDLDRLRAADRLHRLLLQHAQHLGLRLQAHVADLVEEERAAVGQLELAARSATAPVNAPFTWPNSSLSISSSGIAAQLTSTNGPLRAAQRVDGARDQLLAGAVLAVISTRPLVGAAVPGEVDSPAPAPFRTGSVAFVVA